MPFNEPATVYTASGAHRLQLRTARSWWSRLRGLMLTAPLRAESPVQALLIPRCSSVHGFFIRHALDIVYLHRGPATVAQTQAAHRYRVTHIVRLNPWQISVGRRWAGDSDSTGKALRSQHALELPAGAAHTLGIVPGDWLEVST
jgi:uncharacterized membrane protein (UPF0127 family)